MLNRSFTILIAPNPTGQPGEAQLDYTKLRSVATALCFRRNVQQASVGDNDSDAFGNSSEQETLAPSNAGNLVPTTASNRYTKEDLQTMTSSA